MNSYYYSGSSMFHKKWDINIIDDIEIKIAPKIFMNKLKINDYSIDKYINSYDEDYIIGNPSYIPINIWKIEKEKIIIFTFNSIKF